MVVAPVALALHAAAVLSCYAAEQDRRFVIAIAADESQYAIAKILMQRHPGGEIQGSAFHCTHETRTNALVKCSVVQKYGYTKEEGATVAFDDDFFVDKVKRVREKFLAKHRRFVAAHQQHLSREEDPSSLHHHLPPEPASKGLAVWRAVAQDGKGNVTQKPIFFVWQTIGGVVQVAYREEREREATIEREIHTSEEALFYLSASGRTLFTVFSQRMGSVMHSNRVDLVLPFARKRFEPFKVTIINGGTGQYLPVVKRFKGWKIPFSSGKERSVLQPLVKARPPYLALAEHLVDTGFRFLGDAEWLVVSSRNAKDHLRIELPYQP